MQGLRFYGEGCVYSMHAVGAPFNLPTYLVRASKHICSSDRVRRRLSRADQGLQPAWRGSHQSAHTNSTVDFMPQKQASVASRLAFSSRASRPTEA